MRGACLTSRRMDRKGDKAAPDGIFSVRRCFYHGAVRPELQKNTTQACLISRRRVVRLMSSRLAAAD